MNKLIIEANLTDEQIAILANGLWYKVKIQDWEIEEETWEFQEKMELGEVVLDEDKKPVMIPVTAFIPNIINNPVTDDEFVRDYFQEVISDITSDIFAREIIERKEAEKREALNSIKETISGNITTEKR